MGMIIENDVWYPNQFVFIFLFISCVLSIFSLPLFSTTRNNNSTPFDRSVSSSFIRFQTKFLLLFSLSSVLEGLWSVIGEYESSYSGSGKGQIVLSLCLGYATAFLLGTFSGILSDLIGHKIICLVFYALHLFVGVSKLIFSHPSLLLASICLSLASCIFSFSFEAWMVVEHDKLGHRQDTLNDLFWVMIFTESASFIGSQVMGNWLIGDTSKKSLLSSSAAVVLLAIIGIIYLSQRWKGDLQATSFRNYIKSFQACILNDKRVWLLSWAQACLQFSISVFWVMWAPTIVADGREINLGLIYPCFLGAKMLGSTMFPWFSTGPLSFRTEDCVTYAFIIMGLVLSIVSYDYQVLTLAFIRIFYHSVIISLCFGVWSYNVQEVGVLVTLFCLFHACLGIVMPSLAKLRTMYVPNELRGGMISLSLVPANAATLFFVLERGIYQNIENSTIFAFAALGLFSAAGSLYLLKRLGKQPHHNWHKL